MRRRLAAMLDVAGFPRLADLVDPPQRFVPPFRALVREDLWGWRWLNDVALDEERVIRGIQMWLDATYEDLALDQVGVPPCSNN